MKIGSFLVLISLFRFTSVTSSSDTAGRASLNLKGAWGSFQQRFFSMKRHYDRESNEKQAIPALELGGSALYWFRLDDGVMGGRSESLHKSIDNKKILSFEGNINTDGGGFTSIRAKLRKGLLDSKSQAIKLHLKGDGKTYKIFLTNDIPMAGPRSPSPSWQADIATTGEWQDVTVPLDSLVPSFGGPSRNRLQKDDYHFKASEMKQIGLMLSLRLANGDNNPVETFGEGIFPFALQVKSIQLI